MIPKKPAVKKANAAFMKPMLQAAKNSARASNTAKVAAGANRIVLTPVGKPRHFTVAAIRSAIRKASA